jgi:insulysin
MFKFVSLTALALLCVRVECYHVIADQNSLKILSPSLKERKSIKIKLDNNLEVYIISDPDANQSAAALSVESGSSNDPLEYPGMAHFCEHMLFMGSAKYPDENIFWQQIIDNCGTTNAYTKPDRTVYMFSVNHEEFNQTLDIFSGFFINPLFKKDAVKRELNAVNQEHLKNVENDGWREYMVLKETANPTNPNSKFSTGTADTLSIIPIETLKSWYQTHYTANQMHLVIYSNQSIETLTDLTSQIFSKVPEKSPVTKGLDPLLSQTQKGHYIYIEPVQNLRRVSFVWEMPKEAALDNDARIPDMIAYALNAKGDNSLFQSLRSEGLIESMYASQDRLGKDLVLLNVTMDLTKAGVSNIDEISLKTFQALSHLKSTSIPPHLFNEFKKMSTISYQWQSRTSAFDYVSEMADMMIDEPLYSFPQKNSTVTTYKPKAIQAVLEKMTPENTAIFVTAPKDLTGLNYDRKEKWLGANYKILPIESSKLEKWKNSIGDPKLGVAAPNKYIPSNLTILSRVKESLKEKPELLSDDPFGRCYFAKDCYYLVPNAQITLGMRSPEINESIQSSVATDLLVLSLQRKMLPTLFSANRAGLSAYFSKSELKLYLSVDGYSDKIDQLTTQLTSSIKNSPPTKEEFNLLKDELSSDYENQSKTLPFYQASNLLLNLLYNSYPLASSLQETLNKMEYEEFITFHDKVFSKLYVEGTITGNITSEKASVLWKQIGSTLVLNPYPAKEHIKKKTLVLPDGKGPYCIRSETSIGGNAAILMLQLKENSPKAQIAEKILAKATSEAFFNTLRTKQQIAYIAKSWGKEEENAILLFFAVHSATHPPDELLARFELFLEDFSQNFETYVPEERFQAIKNSISISLSKPPENLSAYGSELNALAFYWNGDFARRSKWIKASDAITYDEFKDICLRFLSRQNTKRVAFLVSGSSMTDTSVAYKPISEEELKVYQE